MKAHLGILVLAAALMSGCAGSPPPSPTAPAEASKPTAAPAPTSAPAAPAAPAAPVASPSAAKPVQAASPEAAKPAAPAPASADPRDALSKVFTSWGNTKSFRVKMTTTGAATGMSEMNYEVVLPDRLHMKSELAEAIMADGSFYIKLPTGGWQKIPQAPDFDLANPRKLAEDMGASTDVKLIGPDVLDGQPMLVYEYTTTFSGDGLSAVKPGAKPAGKPESYPSKLWVAVSDGLPRKLEGEAMGAKTTAIYYDYNAPITITAPQ
jgi:hypothetical protein